LQSISSLVWQSVRLVTPMKRAHMFKRRGPDILTLELASVLSGGAWFEFKALFLVVHSNLRARDAANGGEEMLRLRAYEKLQNLVSQGSVEKSAKNYRGNAPALAALKEHLAAEHCRDLMVAVKNTTASVAPMSSPTVRRFR
jgi:hypothetical protein